MFHLISFTRDNPIVQGSSSYNLPNPSDYDLYEVIHVGNNLEEFIQHVVLRFQSMMRTIRRTKDTYFIDFKCSVSHDKTPLHWSLNDVLNGETHHGNHTYQLKDMFEHKSMIKVDVISFIDGLFVPFSNVFSFRLFNSDCGIIYKVGSDIKTLIELLQAGHKSKKIIVKVQGELQQLKSNLANINQFKIPDRIYQKFNNCSSKTGAKSMINALQRLFTMTDRITQLNTLRMMRKLHIK